MGGILVADQFTKFLAVRFLHPFDPVKIIPPFFWFTIRHNSGAAFSLFSGHTFILTIFTTIAAGLIIWWGATLPRGEKTMQTALGLIAGGALGNLVDRFLRGGLVVDFLDVHWLDKLHWPTFNIADTAICIGVGLFVLYTLRQSKKPSAKAGKRGTP